MRQFRLPDGSRSSPDVEGWRLLDPSGNDVRGRGGGRRSRGWLGCRGSRAAGSGGIGSGAFRSVLGVVGGTAVAWGTLIAVAPAIVAAWISGRRSIARAVLGVVVRTAVARRVLVAVAPAVVVMEIHAGDFA